MEGEADVARQVGRVRRGELGRASEMQQSVGECESARGGHPKEPRRERTVTWLARWYRWEKWETCRDAEIVRA